LVVQDQPALFAAVRGVMCDLDYVAALHAGWNGVRRDKIATKDKTVRFIRDVMSAATGNEGYRRWARHLYELYRTGLVHLRAPKVLHNATQNPPRLAWFLMFDRATWEPDLTSLARSAARPDPSPQRAHEGGDERMVVVRSRSGKSPRRVVAG
jgi:hypothetical protein